MSKTSGSNTSVVPAEVADLIEESRTIQGWIDRLASHEGAASPEVFERVGSDYAGRLESVTDKLARHRTDLASSLDTRRGEVDTLVADRDGQTAELEEGTLRHAVGEFSDEAWDERRTSLEGAVSDLAELLEMEQGAVAELAAIVAAIDGGGASSGSAVAEASLTEAPGEPEAVAVDTGADSSGEADEVDPEAAAEAAEEAVAEADEVPAEEAAAAEQEAPAEDDVEITVEAADEAAAAESAGDEEGGDYLDELEFLESLSLDESDRFDAVSAMLDEDEGKTDG